MLVNSEKAVRIAVIAGSGLYKLSDNAFTTVDINPPDSPEPVKISLYTVDGTQVAFLPRHGADHKVPPHRIPYKANIRALNELGVQHILAVNAVGSINPSLTAGQLCIPDQLIDYTWGREHTFFDGLGALDDHIDFTFPYDVTLGNLLASSVRELNIPLFQSGTYGCTQGPRLETAAEIRRMAREGCDVVGQTGMPEAALARELGIAYASLCLVVNPAAGLQQEPVSITEIKQHLSQGMSNVREVLLNTIRKLQKSLS